MEAAVRIIVQNAHQKALDNGKDRYKSILINELLTQLQKHYKQDLTNKQKDTFDRGLWATEERWSNYEGQRIKLGKFLKITCEYCEFFFAKIKAGILN